MSQNKQHVDRRVTCQSRSRRPPSPVDGLAGEAVSLVICVTGAVDDQSGLVTVCVVVTTPVVVGTQVRSYTQSEKEQAPS